MLKLLKGGRGIEVDAEFQSGIYGDSDSKFKAIGVALVFKKKTAFGVAVCAPEDKFNIECGLNIARGRAIEAIVNGDKVMVERGAYSADEAQYALDQLVNEAIEQAKEKKEEYLTNRFNHELAKITKKVQQANEAYGLDLVWNQ